MPRPGRLRRAAGSTVAGDALPSAAVGRRSSDGSESRRRSQTSSGQARAESEPRTGGTPGRSCDRRARRPASWAPAAESGMKKTSGPAPPAGGPGPAAPRLSRSRGRSSPVATLRRGRRRTSDLHARACDLPPDPLGSILHAPSAHAGHDCRPQQCMLSTLSQAEASRDLLQDGPSLQS